MHRAKAIPFNIYCNVSGEGRKGRRGGGHDLCFHFFREILGNFKCTNFQCSVCLLTDFLDIRIAQNNYIIFMCFVAIKVDKDLQFYSNILSG